MLHEEEDERSCSESETQLSRRPSVQHLGEVIDIPLLFLGVVLQGLPSYLHASSGPSALIHSSNTLSTPSEAVAEVSLDSCIQQCICSLYYLPGTVLYAEDSSWDTTKVPALVAFIFLLAGVGGTKDNR